MATEAMVVSRGMRWLTQEACDAECAANPEWVLGGAGVDVGTISLSELAMVGKALSSMLVTTRIQTHVHATSCLLLA